MCVLLARPSRGADERERAFDEYFKKIRVLDEAAFAKYMAVNPPPKGMANGLRKLYDCHKAGGATVVDEHTFFLQDMNLAEYYQFFRSAILLCQLRAAVLAGESGKGKSRAGAVIAKCMSKALGGPPPVRATPL